MSAPPLTLGTAGHIDHGKTALIHALTGVDTDRLPEERARGISIELGYAQLVLPSGRALSVVDVPGHERFVRTMVAGATGIDLFLLVVAADDGVMPQTREHLAVIELLGVAGGVVALTKVDRAGERRSATAAAAVRELLAPGPYSEAPILPVSAVRGDGLDSLRAAIDAAAARARPRGVEGGPPRLHVDRCFTLKGIGTVVTGTLWSGTVAEGQAVQVQPGSLQARVRSVHVHDERRGTAEAGQRVALNLAGVGRHEVARGDVVLAAEADLEPSFLLDVAVRVLAGRRPLERGARVHVHHGTRESPARVAPLEQDAVHPGAEGLVQLRLERAVVAARGDRLVLRQVAPPDTIGGGVVLDPRPRKHGPGEEHVRRLRALESGDPLEALQLELERAPSGLGPQADPELLDRLVRTGAAIRVAAREPRWFSPARRKRARRSLLGALARAEPGRGMSRGALAVAAGLDGPGAAALLDELVSDGEVQCRGGEFIGSGAPSARDDPLARALVSALHEDGLEPRATDALAAATGASREAVTRTLERLSAEGAVLRLRAGVYCDPAAEERARRTVADLCRRDGHATIASLRDELGTSRKYAQAFLEHLDARRVTRRVGDQHVLRAAR
jgi:selenocysteine-specific elongation factor